MTVDRSLDVFTMTVTKKVDLDGYDVITFLGADIGTFWSFTCDAPFNRIFTSQLIFVVQLFSRS